MNNLLVSDKFRKEEKQLKNILKRYEELIKENDSLDKKKIEEIKQSFEALFNFVAVGKVKAGKSSFLNALLGIKKGEEEIFKSAESIETSKITIVKKGKKNIETKGNLVIKNEEIDALEGIEIIDTPGTDAIIEEHGEITKNFLENSNLIMFIFDARNPYTKSEWDLVDEIHNVLNKDIVFILQQKDRATEKEIQASKEEITIQANKKGINKPKIFITSALQEMESKAESGIQELREYIFNEIGNEDKKRMKLKTVSNQIMTSLEKNNQVIEKQITNLKNIKEYYETTKNFLENNEIYIKETLNSMMKSIMNNYKNNLNNATNNIKTIYKNNKKPKEKIKSTLKEFNTHTDEILKSIIDQNIDEIKSEEIDKIDKLFNEKEFFEKMKEDPTLKVSIKNNIGKYLNDYKNLLNKEINAFLDRNFRDIDFKNKNFITKIIRDRKISKQIENEKIEKEKELNQTMKQQSQTFVDEIKTKIRLKLIREDQKIRDEIDKLDGVIKLNDELNKLKEELQNIDSIIE